MSSVPQSGQILDGKYQIDRVLGAGGMGAVVSAHHLQLDQKVAIKYLLPDALLIPEVVERFAREARAAAKIRGEHVARVIDVGKFSDGSPYMVMEYLEGNDLQKQLEREGPLKIIDAVRYLLEACEALAEAHAAKIVHRDLKPSNLFLAQQPGKRAIIKVLDFGISKMEGGTTPSAALTKTSALMGTAYYMSPEQMTSPKGVDARSDIWALGVILYELLAGTPPFPGESMPEIIGGILANNPKPLREHRPEVPPGLEAVVGRCLKTKQDDRFGSVAALAEALGPFAQASDRMSIEITRRVLGESTPPPPSQRTELLPQGSSAPKPPPATAGAPAMAQTPNPALLTQQGLATSMSGAQGAPPAKRFPLGVIVAFGGLLIGIGGAVLVARGGDSSKSQANAGVVTPTITATAPAPTALAPPPETIAPLPAAPPVPVEPPPTTPDKIAGKVAKPVDLKTTNKTKTPGAPSASVAAAPPSPPPVNPPPATSAPASTNKNPLQMGIK